MGIKAIHIILFSAVILGIAALSIPRDREYGVLLNRSAKPHAAKPYLLDSLSANPDDALIVRETAHMYEQLNMPEQAVKVLDAYLVRNPMRSDLRLEAVRICTASGLLEQAIEMLETAPASIQTETRLLALYEQTGQLSKAVELIKGRMNGTDSDAERWLEVARLSLWRTDVTEAASALEQAGRIRQDNETWLKLMWLQNWRGNVSDAAAAADVLEELPRLSADAWRAIRAIRLRVRDLEGSLRAARSAASHEDAKASDIHDLAQILRWAGNDSEAFAVYRRGLKRFSSDADLLRDTGELVLALGRTQEAADLFLRLVRVSDREYDTRRAAEVIEMTGNLKKARSVLDKVIQQQEAELETLLLAGRLAVRDNDTRIATEMVERIEQSDTDRYDILIGLANLYRMLNRPEQEAQTLKRILAVVGEDPDVLLDMAEAYLAREDIVRAQSTLRRAEEVVAVDHARLRRLRARVALMAFRNSDTDALRRVAETDAIQALRETLEDGYDRDLQLELAMLLVRRRNIDEASSLLNQMADVPDWAWLGMVDAYLSIGNERKAREILSRFDDAPELSPDSISYLAYLNGRLGDYDKALALYRLAEDRKGVPGAYALDRADLLTQAGRTEEAYALVDERARKGDIDEWLDAADRRIWNDDRKGEAEVMDSALKRFPDSGRLWARAFAAYMNAGRQEDALLAMKRMREKGMPESASALIAVGESMAALGDEERAEELFRKALELEPGNMEALRPLAELLFQKEKWRDAISVLEVLLKQAPDDPIALYQIGESQYQINQGGRAAWRRFLRVTTGNEQPVLLVRRAHVLWRLGEHAAALRLLKRLRSDDSDQPQVLLDFVYLLLEAGMINDAADLLEDVARQRPDEPEVRNLRAVVLIAQKKYPEARSILQGLTTEYPLIPDYIENLAIVEEATRNMESAAELYRRAADLRRGKR